jgi:hypothetical protein
MAVLRRANFGHRGFNPRQAPTVPAEIDRQHPLANGLTIYLLPQVGGTSIRNLTGLTADLPAFSPSQAVFGMGPRGLEAQSPIVQSYWSGPTLTSSVGVNSGSIWFYGRQVSAYSGTWNIPLIGVTYDNIDSDPYYALSLHRMGSDAGAVELVYNNSSYNSINTGITSIPAGTPLNYFGTVRLGGNAVFYRDGQLYSNTAAPAGTISITNTALTLVGNVAAGFTGAGMVAGAVWSRELSAGEVAWMSAEPFAMLRPIQRRRFYLPSAVAAPAGKRPRITMIA